MKLMKEEWFWILGGAVFVAAVALLVVWVIRENRAWERYKLEHDCQQTEETRTVMINSGKTMVPVTHHRWECHDGQEHWH